MMGRQKALGTAARLIGKRIRYIEGELGKIERAERFGITASITAKKEIYQEEIRDLLEASRVLAAIARE